MTPEEAQRKSEEKWKAIAAGKDIPPSADCGWCEFSKELRARYGRYTCIFCPVLRVHGVGCCDLDVLDAFLTAYSLDEWADAALAVYEFLCQMGSQYIAVAHEILEELPF